MFIKQRIYYKATLKAYGLNISFTKLFAYNEIIYIRKDFEAYCLFLYTALFFFVESSWILHGFI